MAVRTWANVPGVAAQEVQYLHPDHLGSIGQITSQTGGWVQDVYFYPYGGIRWSRDGGTTPSPASATRRTYTGQYDIGFWAGAIQHYNARQYDYVLGRFLQPDTVTADPGNPHDLNRYMYVRGNPTNATDPTGHIPTILIGAIIGGAIGVGLYAWNESVNGNGLQWSDWQDAAVAMGTGALAGGLIGSGIGAAGGIALVTGGAGAGMAGALLSDHVSNLASGQDFSATEHVTTGAFGLMTGAVGMAPGFSLGGRMVIGGTLGMVEAAVMARYRGQEQEFDLDDLAGGAVRGAGSMFYAELPASIGWLDDAGKIAASAIPGTATVGSTMIMNALYDPSTYQWGYDPVVDYPWACRGRRCDGQQSR